MAASLSAPSRARSFHRAAKMLVERKRVNRVGSHFRPEHMVKGSIFKHQNADAIHS
jgi:hypothetical protein